MYNIATDANVLFSTSSFALLQMIINLLVAVGSIARFSWLHKYRDTGLHSSSKQALFQLTLVFAMALVMSTVISKQNLTPSLPAQLRGSHAMLMRLMWSTSPLGSVVAGAAPPLFFCLPSHHFPYGLIFFWYGLHSFSSRVRAP